LRWLVVMILLWLLASFPDFERFHCSFGLQTKQINDMGGYGWLRWFSLFYRSTFCPNSFAGDLFAAPGGCHYGWLFFLFLDYHCRFSKPDFTREEHEDGNAVLRWMKRVINCTANCTFRCRNP
jgi:hypothetical protein